VKSLDIAWAIQELESFVDMTEPVNRSRGGYITTSSGPASPRQVVLDQWPVVKEILDIAYPAWSTENLVDASFEFGKQRDAATQCIAILRRQSELQEKLGSADPAIRISTFTHGFGTRSVTFGTTDIIVKRYNLHAQVWTSKSRHWSAAKTSLART